MLRMKDWKAERRERIRDRLGATCGTLETTPAREEGSERGVRLHLQDPFQVRLRCQSLEPSYRGNAEFR